MNLKSSEEATYSITVHIPKGENSILPTADMVGFFAPEGQRFDGWKYGESTEVDYPGGEVFNTEAEGKELVDGTILYPCWADEDTYTITIDYGYDGKTETKVVKKGSWVVLDIPEREDYVFDGWKDSNDKPVSSSGFVAESDMTVTAKWKDACIVRFNGNGGKPFVDYLIVAKGSCIELPQAVWDGREFLGWFDPAGNKVSETITIDSDIDFKAEWRDLVRYHLNPDDPEEFVWVDTPAQAPYETSKYDSISDGYTRDDARFIGWADSSDLIASNVKYYGENDEVSDGTADLYAVWLSGTLYFERQCQGDHGNLKKDLEKRELWPWREGDTDKTLFYRITLDLNQEDKQFKLRQIGSPSNDDKTELYISPVLGGTKYDVWWNSVVVPDTITGGYKNWNVQIDRTGSERPEKPKYYPNTSNESSEMEAIQDNPNIWTIDPSILGDNQNCASYGLRDDKIVEVTISFGKTAEGNYLYQKTIPFGKAINVEAIKKKDSTNENIVIFPDLSDATDIQIATDIQEVTNITDTPDIPEITVP